ncbi:polysaccharide lyase 6 family protein [Pedobacter psychrophilus]|nr:polysaccharide lyase 6 family protein [Pedobacter psychrophilus]
MIFFKTCGSIAHCKRNTFIKGVLISFLLFNSQIILAKDYYVANLPQFNKAVTSVKAGDQIIMAEGRWENVKLIFKANGDKNQLIQLRAAIPSKTIICGKSSLQLSGSYLKVSDLLFTSGEPIGKNAIEFKDDGGNYASYSVLSNCAIVDFNNPDKKIRKQWVDLYGRYNTVEYCYFEGKTDLGVVLSVEIDADKGDKNFHSINHNYFAKRLPYNDNGGEIIRIARGEVQMLSSNTLVEDNYFEHCDGENEIISVKSSDNIIRGNNFYECAGGVSLRHGERNIVYGNYFLANNKEESSGVKIHFIGHKVYNNLFYKVAGNTAYTASIALIAGHLNPTLLQNEPVKDVEIANNTFVNCALPFNFGTIQADKALVVLPKQINVCNNLIYSPKSEEWSTPPQDISKLFIINNLVVLESKILFNDKIILNPVFNKSNGLFNLPYSRLIGKLPTYVEKDILQIPRKQGLIGAFEYPEKIEEVKLPNADNCGPQWYKPKTTN